MALPRGTDKFAWMDAVLAIRMDLETKAVAFVLAYYADRDGTSIHPGDDRLAVELDRSERTIRNQRKRLLDMGLVELVSPALSPGRGGGRGRAAEWALCLPDDLGERFVMVREWLWITPNGRSPVAGQSRNHRSPATGDSGNDRSPVTESPVTHGRNDRSPMTAHQPVTNHVDQPRLDPHPTNGASVEDTGLSTGEPSGDQPSHGEQLRRKKAIEQAAISRKTRNEKGTTLQ